MAAAGRVLRWPAYPIVLAAYSVLLIYADNLAEGVEPAEVVPPLVVTVSATALLYAVLWMVQRSARRAALTTTAIVVPCMLFASIVEFIDPLWAVPSLVRSQLVALLLCLVAALLGVSLATSPSRDLGRTTEALNVVALVLVVLVALPILRFMVWPDEARALSAVAVAKPSEPGDTPGRDIYHFVFDRYGSEAGLAAEPGIDNSDFVGWLEEQGFQVAGDARANYWRTLPSLSSVFRMSLLDDVAEEMGPSNPNPRPLHELLRTNPAAATLQGLGYTYIHLGAWYREFTRSDIADHVHAPGYQFDFARAVYDSTAIPFVQGLLAIAAGPTDGGTNAPRALATLEQVELVEAMATVPGPKLVYAHFLVPHRPFLFLEDGTIAPGEATFESQLRYTNRLIERLVEPLLELPADQQPIIILQADEGPFPERYDEARNDFDWTAATDDELLTKFGILSAWYLPGPEGEPPVPSGITLVNTYPEILGRYFGVEVERSPDRSFVGRHGRLYDQLEVTERLEEAAE